MAAEEKKTPKPRARGRRAEAATPEVSAEIPMMAEALTPEDEAPKKKAPARKATPSKAPGQGG